MVHSGKLAKDPASKRVTSDDDDRDDADKDDDDEGEDEDCAAPLVLVLVSCAAQFTTIWQHARPQSQSSLWRRGQGLCLWPGLGLGQRPGVGVRIKRGGGKGQQVGHLRLIYLGPQRHFRQLDYELWRRDSVQCSTRTCPDARLRISPCDPQVRLGCGGALPRTPDSRAISHRHHRHQSTGFGGLRVFIVPDSALATPL